MQRRLFQEVLNSSSNWKAIYEQPCTGTPLFRNDVSLSHTCQGRVQHSRIRYVQIIIHPAEYPTASALCKQMISLGQTGIRRSRLLWIGTFLKPRWRVKISSYNIEVTFHFLILFTLVTVIKLSFNQAPIETQYNPMGSGASACAAHAAAVLDARSLPDAADRSRRGQQPLAMFCAPIYLFDWFYHYGVK